MAAVLLAMIWLPVSARASGHIIIEWTSQPADPYVLQADANDGNGLLLTSMTVHMFSGTRRSR